MAAGSIAGYILAVTHWQRVHPLHTKCWHQVDPLQKRPMGAFSQFSPLGEALPEPLPHITNLKPKDFILHILYFQWMPFYKVCKKSRGVAGSFCKKSVKSFEEDTKTLAQVLCFSTKRPYLAVCSVAQVLPFLWVFSHPRSKNYMQTLYKMTPL